MSGGETNESVNRHPELRGEGLDERSPASEGEERSEGDLESKDPSERGSKLTFVLSR